jgi:uncharacterized protein with beta-barrel porin domain
MRKFRRIQLAGLAALAGTGAAGTAAADDLQITTAQTNPVLTSSAGAAPGTVTVTTTGSITLDGIGEAAITVDSNHSVLNQGTLSAVNVNGTGGIHILDGFSGTISNAAGASINFTDGYALADGDNDGDLDGEFATGTGRYGIMLDAGAYTGNIVNAGGMSIEGNNSYGILLNGLLDGDGTTTGNLTSTGNINLLGDNNVGISVQGGITGDLISRGNISASGEGTRGIVVNGVIGGEMRLNGGIQVTGFHHVPRFNDPSKLEAEDLLLAGAAVQINSDVLGGLTIEGIGQEDDDDDDGDGELNEGNDNATATITSIGSAPALLIQADGANVSLGDTPAPGAYGLHNLGDIGSNGIYDNIDAVAMRLEGVGGSTVTTAGGINNEGGIGAQAREANAVGLSIGADVSVLVLNNIGTITGTTVGEAGGDSAIGLLIDAGATNVGTLNNTGIITGSASGNGNNTVAVRDLSGTLLNITNQNRIQTGITAHDADAPVTGATIALDLAAASGVITINQTENADTDIDEVILGDIILGAFGDTLNLHAGGISGDITFGAGLDTFDIDGAEYVGTIVDDGGLNINVLDGMLRLTGGGAHINNADFGLGSTLEVSLSGNPLDAPIIQADGAVTFAADAIVIPNVPTGLIEATQVFLTAASMTGGANVVGLVDGEGTPFVYNLTIALTNPGNGDGLANGLEATYEIKTAAQLGLTDNQATAFDPILEALRQDDAASNAFISLEDQASFIDAYQDLMPSYASASAEIAMTAIQQMQSATSNRLAATRLQGLDEVSAWAQEIGYGLNREPPTANGQEFRGHGFGMATGIDGPLDNGALFGLSASFIASEVEEPSRPDGEISASIGQLNAYLGTAMGPFDLDFIVGAGTGKMQSRRFVEIADTFASLSEADWMAYEGHGAVRLSAPMSMSDWMVVTPQAALTYVYLNEDGYVEEGGGAAIDYEVDSATSQRLWGDVGVEFSGRFRMGPRSVIAPRLFAGYRANLIDEEAERTFRFASTGDEFSLIDEALGDGGPLIGLGVDATNGYSTVAIGYEGEFGDQIERHSLNVAVRFRF